MLYWSTFNYLKHLFSSYIIFYYKALINYFYVCNLLCFDHATYQIDAYTKLS